MMTGPVVSVCILSAGRTRQLDACLSSLVAQESAPESELLVCANDDDGAETVVRRHFPEATVIQTSRSRLGAARNRLIAEASGDLLLFLDDDVIVPPLMLHRLVELARNHPEVSVFGGPNTTPPGSTHFQRVQGTVLASIVTSGPVRRRYGHHPPGPADERFFTLCNMAVRRDSMRNFDSTLTGGEENHLLIEMSTQGLSMHYDPHLNVWHQRRPSLASFARQMFKYGSGRGQVMVRSPRHQRLEYLLPTLLLAYWLLLPILASINITAAIPGLLYLIAVGAASTKIAWRMHQPAAAPLACGLILTVHFLYAFGLVGGVRIQLWRRLRARRSTHDLRDSAGELEGSARQ